MVTAINRTRAAMVQVGKPGKGNPPPVSKSAPDKPKFSGGVKVPAKPAKPAAKVPFKGGVKVSKAEAAALAVPPSNAKRTKKPATEEVVGNKGAIIKLPKSLAECADDLFTTQKARLALDKQSEALKARETALKTKIIENLPKTNATGISGMIANVKVVTREIPSVNDWDKFYDFLVDSFIAARKKKNGQQYGVFSLLQKRVGDTAVKELWEAKKVVPGVENYKRKDVSITKV